MKQLQEAMELYEKKTCIRFKEVKENALPIRYLTIKILDYSSCECPCAGNTGNLRWNTNDRKMSMTFTNSFECGDFTWLVLHELGHVVGLAHTQRRHDRDEHITVFDKCFQRQDAIRHCSMSKDRWLVL